NAIHLKDFHLNRKSIGGNHSSQKQLYANRPGHSPLSKPIPLDNTLKHNNDNESSHQNEEDDFDIVHRDSDDRSYSHYNDNYGDENVGGDINHNTNSNHGD